VYLVQGVTGSPELGQDRRLRPLPEGPVQHLPGLFHVLSHPPQGQVHL